MFFMIINLYLGKSYSQSTVICVEYFYCNRGSPVKALVLTFFLKFLVRYFDFGKADVGDVVEYLEDAPL